MQLPAEFIKKVVRCFEDEENDIYALTLYSMDADDLDYFNETDRKRVREIFQTLMDDTRRHAELLKLIVELGGG